MLPQLTFLGQCFIREGLVEIHFVAAYVQQIHTVYICILELKAGWLYQGYFNAR